MTPQPPLLCSQRSLQNEHEGHNREHVPERAAIPGFNRGRRYIAVNGGPEYFNLYEADTVETVGGADDVHALNHPTDWTRKVVAQFRDVARSTCAVAFSDAVTLGDLPRGRLLHLCLFLSADMVAHPRSRLSGAPDRKA
jgi:hypothetical protein